MDAIAAGGPEAKRAFEAIRDMSKIDIAKIERHDVGDRDDEIWTDSPALLG